MFLTTVFFQHAAPLRIHVQYALIGFCHPRVPSSWSPLSLTSGPSQAFVGYLPLQSNKTCPKQHGKQPVLPRQWFGHVWIAGYTVYKAIPSPTGSELQT
jgi:hypothetical protein